MAFQSVKAFVVADNDKFEANQELERLYKIKDALVSDIKKYEEDKKKVVDLTKDVNRLLQEKTNLDFEVFKYKEEYNKYSEEVKELKEDIEFLNIKKLELLSDVSKLTKDLDKVSNDFNFEVKKNKDILNLKVKEIEEIDKKINSKSVTLSDLNNNILLLSKSNNELIIENNKLSQNKNKLISENSELTRKVTNKNNDLKKIQGSIEIEKGRQSKVLSDFESDFNKKRMDANTEIEKMYKDKEKEMFNREGYISEKESWLLKREQKLKEIKNDLEVFYNKKIDNIIF